MSNGRTMTSSDERGRVIADLLIEWHMSALDAESIGLILVSAAGQCAADCHGVARENKRATFEALARRATAAAQLLDHGLDSQ